MQHTYEDRQAPEFSIQPPGDYLCQIVKAEERIVNGKELLAMQATFGNGGRVFDDLYFTPAAGWRVDVFLKATGHTPAIGETVDITPETVIGWQFWAEIGIENFIKKDQSQGTKNKILRFIADRPLPIPPAPTAAPNWNPQNPAGWGDTDSDDSGLPF